MRFDVAGGSHKEPNHSSHQCVREEPNRSITIAQQMLVLISILEIDMAFSLAKFLMFSQT